MFLLEFDGLFGVLDPVVQSLWSWSTLVLDNYPSHSSIHLWPNFAMWVTLLCLVLVGLVEHRLFKAVCYFLRYIFKV